MIFLISYFVLFVCFVFLLSICLFCYLFYVVCYLSFISVLFINRCVFFYFFEVFLSGLLSNVVL